MSPALKRYVAVCGACFVASFFLSGTLESGGLYVAAARDPFRALLEPADSYRYGSPLFMWVLYFLGAARMSAALTLTTALVLAAAVAVCAFVWRALDERAATTVAILVLSHPAPTVMFHMIAPPDAITFGCVAVCLFCASPWAILAACLVGALNHPLIVIAAPSVLLLRRLSGFPRLGRFSFAAAAVGLVLGRLVVMWYLATFLPEAHVSRLRFVMDKEMEFWGRNFFLHLPLAVFSFHGLAWFAMAFCFRKGFSRRPTYFSALVALHLLFLPVTFFALDTTRVYALLAWAPLVHCVAFSLSDERLASPELGRTLRLVAVGSIFTPRVDLVAGKVMTGFYQFWQRTLIESIVKRGFLS